MVLRSNLKKGYINYNIGPRKLFLADFDVVDANKLRGVVEDFGEDKVGRKVLRFAASCANKMETAMKQGKTLQDSFEPSLKATLKRNRIEPNAQNWGISLLTRVWKHGEELAELLKKGK